MMADRGTIFTLLAGGKDGNIYQASPGTRALLALQPQTGQPKTYRLGQEDPKTGRKLSEMGVYCFVPKLPKDFKSFYIALARDSVNFPGFIQGKAVQFFAWISDPTPDNLTILCSVEISNDRKTKGPISFPFQNANLNIPEGASVKLNDTNTGFVVSGDIQLVPTADAKAAVSVAAVDILIPAGDGQGTLEFDVVLDEAQLDALDVGLRYAFDASGKTVSQRYPVFSVSDAAPGVALHARLDPFKEDSPTDSVYTFTGKTAISSYLRSIYGLPVALTPENTGTAQAPQLVFTPKPDGKAAVYLAPTGSFAVTPVSAQPESASGKKTINLMGGLSGSEFLLLASGDTLTFANNKPAFAKGFDPGKPGETPLTDDFTTSWVQVHMGGRATSDVDTIATSYCAQPSSSTYFAHHKNQTAEDFPVAVGIALAQLAATENLYFPLVPYGGVFKKDSNPNPDLEAKTVGAFEKQVIEPTRRKLIEPYFDKTYGPIFFDTATNKALSGGFARTPMGFVASLNESGAGGKPPAGSWLTLQLAKSPQNPDQYLQLKPNKNDVVNAEFSNASMRDNLFMVITSPDLLWPSMDKPGNEIKLGDFTFEVEIGTYNAANDENHPKALVIFKFMLDVRFVELIDDTERWAKFFGPGDDALKVQAQIKRYLDAAATGDKDLYAAFNAIVNDPKWTGILVFNCKLDYQALPSDIQILLGGIDGALRAHHFGITINRVGAPHPQGSTDLMIDSSSLFAVIDYNKEFSAPTESEYPKFQVLKLNVEYANSKLVVFNARIAFSFNALFGNKTKFTKAFTKPPKGHDHPETGTIVIDGVYTLHEDGTGSLVFATDAKRAFSFPAGGDVLRVLQVQSVTNAALVPVESKKLDGKVKAIASFRLDGTLAFNDKLKDGVAGDLFSFGDVQSGYPDKGLVITDYAFAMTTNIPDSGDSPADLEPITTDLTGVKVDQVMSKSRPDSFDKTFPGNIDSVDYVEGGLGTTKPGAWQINNDALEAIAPQYMLHFKVPMGSLGGLVSSTNNIVSDLYIGWISGGTEAAADKIGAVLMLPAVVAGPDGFKIQGIAPARFESVHLDRQEIESKVAYDLRFQHYSASLIGIPLIAVLEGDANGKDLGIFGSPTDPGGQNAMWYVGKSEKPWIDGIKVSSVLADKLPTVFIGRAFAIETDPTDPNVIDDAIEELEKSFPGNPLNSITVAKFMEFIYANSGKYNSSAGIAFALKFAFKAVKFAALFHDDDFYGAKIKIEFGGDDEEEDSGDDKEKEKKEDEKKEDEKKEDEKKKGVNKLEGLEFSIIYRRISDHLGVWSATIFIDVGTIEIGAGSLTLPDFSISVWTNGDWRFSVGWPISDNPVIVQFMAGPVPVIGKLGFYLAKLSSEAAPSKFLMQKKGSSPPVYEYPPNFHLIWSFGLGISAGVGKKFKKGPLSASASLTIGLNVEGFLASFSGNMSKDGVDYYWWCVSLDLVGEVGGKVDFKIISVSLSITLTLKAALALENYHATQLVLTFQVKVKASVKIIFFTIHFSFDMKLTLLRTTIGSGPPAKLDGPTPKLVEDRLTPKAERMVSSRMPLRAMAMAMREAVEAAPAVTVKVNFLMQSTAVSTDGQSFIPHGVATLVIENKDMSSAFHALTNGLAEWLLAHFGEGAESFEKQLDNVEKALAAGQFDNRVDECLRSQFVFHVGSIEILPSKAPPPVAVMPVHPSLGVDYHGTKTPFGLPAVPGNYADIVNSYFAPGGQLPQPTEVGTDSVASLLFNEYFLMFAQQLVARLQQAVDDDKATNLENALTQPVLTDVGGFVSRFLMGGIRLPKPDKLTELQALYALTHQQFPLEDDVDSVELIAASTLPEWFTLDGSVTAKLDPSQWYESAPDKTPWTIGSTNPVSPAPLRFPINASLDWKTGNSTEQTIFKFADGLHLAIEDWRGDPPKTAGPWLKLRQVTGTNSDGKAYEATGALILPLSIKKIQKPGGKIGESLKDIYSLVGTDEVHRAYLQALLDDPNLNIAALDLTVNESQGKYASTKAPPKVLVRTNLSTSTAPAGGGSAAARAVGEANDAPSDPHCANYAKPADGGAELAKFLRLVWECSVVHTGGFYLQVEGLQDDDKFKGEELSLQLVVQTGKKNDIIAAEPYHNALIGAAPDDDSAVVADLKSDAAGSKSVVRYTASYPGGSVGWSITWQNPPTELDATGDAAAVLQGLYQLVSYRVTAVGGSAHQSNWSRPVTALHSEPDKKPQWNYQESFPTAPLIAANANTYAAIGKQIDVAISVEDVFGNSLPHEEESLTVVYNDDIRGLANWADTQTSYAIGEASAADKVRLAVSFSYGSLLFSSGDFIDLKALVAKLQGQDPVSKFVWDGLGAEIRNVLKNKDATPNEVQVALLTGLNDLIGGRLIYEQSRFVDVTLRPQTKSLVAKNPSGNLLVFLNGMLLQDAYPAAIKRQVQSAYPDEQSADATDDDTALKRARDEYLAIQSQLQDPNLSAAINTGNLLAPDTPVEGTPPSGVLTKDAMGAAVVEGLGKYVDGIVAWLDWHVAGKPTTKPADIPEPATLEFYVDKNFPRTWDGDLRELRVSLLLRRDGVTNEVADKAPQVRFVASPLAPVQGKSTAADPTGLSTFALSFEKAYYKFDGAVDGVIKVATGINSDLKSRRLGMQSLWLARWGNTHGIRVTILNDDENMPVYYAPPPLSTRLITREVKDLLDYSHEPPNKIPSQVFSSVDLDRIAANFLSSVEGIFSPQIAPAVAELSKPTSDHMLPVYDGYVQSKTHLAKYISDTLAFIYQSMEHSGEDGKSDINSAIETLRQALLHTLENDYGISTLVQLAAMINLHGEIEPDGASPPYLYGNISPPTSPKTDSGDNNQQLPFNFSPAKLPLTDGKAWLNFLLSVQYPAEQKALKMDLDYQMGFIEHNIDPAATRCNYTPSQWLTFVLQQNEKTLPRGKDNTLTAQMGEPRIPIPLRSYPSLPKLLLASATQATSADCITSIEEALRWTYKLTVERPVAAQDTFNLMVTFNEPPVPPKEEMFALGAARSGDLFDALARYSYEYPQLEPKIQALAQGISTESAKAVTYFRDLVDDVTKAWPSWKQPAPPEQARLQSAGDDYGHEMWSYTIDHEKNGSLSCRSARTSAKTALTAQQNPASPPWPEIDGYKYPPVQDSTDKERWTYTLDSGTTAPAQLSFTWKNFYILDYQSARASAFIERNRNLGGDTGEKTNEAFVYRTETVSMPTSAVPLIRVPKTIPVPLAPTLQESVTSMFKTMHTPPGGSLPYSGPASDLKVEGPIAYAFRLLDNIESLRSFLPLFLMEKTIAPGAEIQAGQQVAINLDKWRDEANPKVDASSISFQVTIFATKIVSGTEQLPLVQFQDLSLDVPDANDGWWKPST